MSVLEEAKEAIYGDREKTYGNPAKNLKVIAGLWETYLELPPGTIKPEDVCNMMIALKIARLKNTPTHHDSMVDVAGYAALSERIQKNSAECPETKPTGSTTAGVYPSCFRGVIRDEAELTGGDKLLLKVREVDEVAYKWLSANIPRISLDYPDARLSALFNWNDAPQGVAYWMAVSDKLPQEYR